MKALVVIPTYNERGNIENIVADIISQSDIVEVLIVDDNSPDGSGELADRMAASNSRVHVKHRAGKLGLGSAYIEYNDALAQSLRAQDAGRACAGDSPKTRVL